MSVKELQEDIQYYILENFLDFRSKYNLAFVDKELYSLINNYCKNKYYIDFRNIKKIACKYCINLDDVSNDYPGYCVECVNK
jgi:hypothetical protein